MRLFLLFKMLLELIHPSLKVRVYIDVSVDDSLHALHVLVNVVLHRANPLDIRYEFSLLREELRCFFQVL